MYGDRKIVFLEDLIVSQYIISQSSIGTDITLDRVSQMRGPDKWAIREEGFCLNKKGEWEYEPLPSSRTDEFIKQCRYSTSQEALAVWNEHGKSRFEHYKK